LKQSQTVLNLRGVAFPWLNTKSLSYAARLVVKPTGSHALPIWNHILHYCRLLFGRGSSTWFANSLNFVAK
jgi:hypothetical protein